MTDVRTMIFELRFLPYGDARLDGNLRRSDGWINLPLFWTWKESEAGRVLRDVQTGCWYVRTDTSWYRIFSTQWRVWTEKHVVRTYDAWSVGHLDGMARHPDGWNSGHKGVRTGWLDRPNGWHGNRKSSITLLNSGIPCTTASLQTSDFVQTQNEANNTNNRLSIKHTETSVILN
jgi:hypothetical protein